MPDFSSNKVAVTISVQFTAHNALEVTADQKTTLWF